MSLIEKRTTERAGKGALEQLEMVQRFTEFSLAYLVVDKILECRETHKAFFEQLGLVYPSERAIEAVKAVCEGTITPEKVSSKDILEATRSAFLSVIAERIMSVIVRR